MQDTLLEMTLVFEVASGDATNFWISLDLKECRCLLQPALLHYLVLPDKEALHT
jgi:hypothetical protein